MGVVVLVALVVAVLWLRRRFATKRLPTLTHDYSADRGIYQRWPKRQRRRFK
jgi:hypothetical protein